MKRLPRYATFFFMFMLCVLAIHSLSNSITDIFSYRARLILEKRDQYPERLANATRLMPYRHAYNPEHLELDNLLRHWKVAMHTENSDMAELAAILQDYREILELRPTWPFTWANFAKAKAAANEFDREFLITIEQVFRLAPTRYDVQLVALEVALQHWFQIPYAMRSSLIDKMEFGFTQYPVALEKTVNRFRLMPTVCAYLSTPLRDLQQCTDASHSSQSTYVSNN